MTRLAAAFVALSVTVAGCATPTVEIGNPRSVTINRTAASEADAQRVADEHCQKFGRYARPSRDLGMGRNSFDCVD